VTLVALICADVKGFSMIELHALIRNVHSQVADPGWISIVRGDVGVGVAAIGSTVAK
jgi:hypothetical protein